MRTLDALPVDHFPIEPRPEFVARATHRESRVTMLCGGIESRLRANISPAASANPRRGSISPNAQLRSARVGFRSATRQCRRRARSELPGQAEFPGAD